MKACCSQLDPKCDWEFKILPHLWQLHLSSEPAKGRWCVAQAVEEDQQVLVDAITGRNILPGQLGKLSRQAAKSNRAAGVHEWACIIRAYYLAP